MLVNAGLPKMVAAIILFAVGLVLLIKCGDWFVDGASGIAKKLHVPELLIGATVVSIGTTLPEVWFPPRPPFRDTARWHTVMPSVPSSATPL